MQTKVRSPFKVPKQTFTSLPMNHSRSLHKLTQLLNNEGNLKSCKSNILKRANSLSIQGRVIKKAPEVLESEGETTIGE